MPSRPARSTSRLIAPVVITAMLAGGAGWWLAGRSAPEETAVLHVTDGTAVQETSAPVATSGEVTYERLANPPRTVVRDEAGTVVAVLTDGARTAVITGPERTFSEPVSTDATLTTTSWVRLAPQAWKAGAEKSPWFKTWFAKARKDTSPDVFAVGFQYVQGAPEVRDEKGLRIAGDAAFGPFKASGEGRLEANDFYDYLGVNWSFPDRSRPERPEAARYGALDCSGFVRIVYGYRLGMPLRGTNDPGPGLPRRAFAIAQYGPGVEIVPDRKRTATDYNALQPGDLVFFEIEDGPQLDHVGIYMGVDDRGHHRFLSSRDRINGPTMGDVGGTSLLDDGGFYSRGWHAARRV